MRPEKIFRPPKGKWPRPRGRCSVCARLWSLLPAALILMAVLCFASCATTKKTRTEQTRTEQIKESSDTAASAIRTIRKEAVPSSKAEIAIPVDSLLRLPSQAVYTQHSGQATATVAKKGEVIYVAATCDSLQREVEYYEELYYKARDALEAYEHETLNERRESKEPLENPILIFMIGITAGALATASIIINKKDKRE